MTRLVAAVLLALLLAAAAAAPAVAARPAAAAGLAPAVAQPVDGPVLIVGAPGLRWDDVDAARTPVLQRLASAGSIGVLSVRSAGARSCPADGWVSAGAGNRARVGPAAAGAQPCPEAVPGVDALPSIARDNAGLRQDAEIDALARVLLEADRCLQAVGGPGAQLVTGPRSAASAAPSDTPAPLAGCAVTVADAGPVRHDDRLDGDLRRVDQLVDRLASAALQQGGTVLVAGLSDTSDRGDTGSPTLHLHVAIAAGPAFPAGSLTSGSTRRAPYVQVIDLAPTVLALLGLPQPAAMTGQPWRHVQQRFTAAELHDLDRRARAMDRSTEAFFGGLFAVQLLAYGAAFALRRKLPTGWVFAAALGFTAVPACTYLANLLPWWRAGSPLPALVGVVTLFVTVVVAVALVGPWRPSRLGPIGAVCAISALVLIVDLVTGAHLQMSSVAGYSPLVAGRFAGIGNVAFGVLAAAVLLATASLLHGRSRRASLLTCGLIGLAAVLVDGHPSWGSDFGGVLALIPGFAVLFLLAAGIRVSLTRLVAVAAAAVAAVVAFALLDYQRDAQDRTHLGRFAAQVVDGDAATVLGRKAAANLDLLTTNVFTLIVPLVLLLAAALVHHPPPPLARAFEQAPVWRAGLVAVLVTSLIGFLVNDSGVAVPALTLTVAIPATVAVVVRPS